MAGKGSALLLLAGKLGKGLGGKKPPRPAPSEPDMGSDEDSDSGSGTDKEVAGEDLATALKSGDHRAIYEAVCAILDMHKAHADTDSDSDY